jgi:phosphoenolpyruvate carboxykinase (GTP)
MAPEWEDPAGVPIDAILFGGRRSRTVPLVFEAFSWPHAVFVGATMSSETTAAASGEVGKLRRDPMAMLPFCGYHMGDYFGHWLHMGASADASKLPRVFHVNWFRKDARGKFLWPGFGDNSRVLAWVFRRCDGEAEALDTPIGRVPAPGAIDRGRRKDDVTGEQMDQLLAVDRAEWRKEAALIEDFLDTFGNRLPGEMREQLTQLEQRLAG